MILYDSYIIIYVYTGLSICDVNKSILTKNKFIIIININKIAFDLKEKNMGGSYMDNPVF